MLSDKIVAALKQVGITDVMIEDGPYPESSSIIVFYSGRERVRFFPYDLTDLINAEEKQVGK